VEIDGSVQVRARSMGTHRSAERGVAVNTDSTALPDLSSYYRLASEPIEEFRAKGHTVVRRLASASEIACYRPVIEAAALAHTRETRPLEERDTYGKAFLQITNLWRVDPGVARFVRARRFAKVAADLLGVAGVRLYHDQALFKEAGGGRTPWHRDEFYWPLDGAQTITMWMPLVDVPSDIGTMTFASGSHTIGDLGSYHISDESEAVFQRLITEHNLPLETHGALAAGDATFHAGGTLHSAPPNPTDVLRSVMTVIYFADGLRVAEPRNPGQQLDLHFWLPGLKPGDLAASPINPCLYPPTGEDCVI
jgi:ectoine hydroxylase-related dioxygenase (phytanoyl-CoA dioxygenase family)